MYSLIVTNPLGQSLRLSHNGDYNIIAIDGLTPPTATLNSSPIPGADGAIFNSSYLEPRNIVLTIVPNFPIEKNRISLYKMFPVKQKVKLHYTNGSRDVMIEGYVESVQGNLFTAQQSIQISIMCYEPYFKSAAEIINDLSQILSAFEFPFSTESEGTVFSEINTITQTVLVNAGEAQTGCVITINFSGDVTDPVIYDATNNTYIKIVDNFENGDVLIINTIPTQKSITLIRDGVEYNRINNLSGTPTWFSLNVGETVFAYDAASGADHMAISFSHYDLYQGV